MSSFVTIPIMELLKKYPLFFGIFLIFLFTWPIDMAAALASLGIISASIPKPVILSVGYGFVAASLIMTGVIEGKRGVINLLRRFLYWRVGWRWYATLAIIPSASILALGLHYLVFNTPIHLKNALGYVIFGDSANLFYLAVPWFVFTTLTNMEEIGWRGYVLPRMQKRYGALASAILVGMIWAAWHFPKYLAGGFFIVFLLSLCDAIAKSIMLAWIYNNTNGSLLITTLFHSSMNTAAILLPLPNTLTGGDPTIYITIILIEIAIAAGIVAYAGPSHLSRTFQRQIQE